MLRLRIETDLNDDEWVPTARRRLRRRQGLWSLWLNWARTSQQLVISWFERITTGNCMCSQISALGSLMVACTAPSNIHDKYIIFVQYPGMR